MRNRLTAVACAMGLAAALSGREAGAQTGTAIPPTDKNIVYVGRWDRDDPGSPHGNWIGSYIRTDFSGTSVSAVLADNKGLDVIIDNGPTQVVTGGPGAVALNSGPLAPGVHTLEVGIKGGGGWTFKGLALDAGASTLPAPRRPILEAIGDSITCGSGAPVEAGGNYNVLTAEALGFDHVQTSWPGRSLMTGYGYQDDHAGLDTQYFMRNCFYDKPAANWDMSTYIPRVILINLGQNDGEGDAPFQATYLAFVKKIRSCYPHTQIALLRPFSGNHAAAVQSVVSQMNAAGDTGVHFIDTTGWLKPEDFGDGVHPNEYGNLKVSERLTPLLMPILSGKPFDPEAPVVVGDPMNPSGLNRSIQSAYIRGSRTIVIKPGFYKMATPHDTQLPLDRWQDATVSAYHVILMLDNSVDPGALVRIDDCNNVTLEGALLSQTAQTASQGRVVAIGKDDAGDPTCDWQVSAGYPPPHDKDLPGLWIDFVNAKTKLINTEAGDYYHTKLTPMGNGLYRVSLENRPIRFSVGDYIVARYDPAPAKVGLSGSFNCTVKDVTMMRNGFAPIFDGEGGGNHYLNCHWALGPRPAGATEDPVVTNAADGIHSPDDSIGPDIENCTFEGVFLDDCIAIHGGFHRIHSVDGQKVTADNGYAFYAVGEPVRISNDHGFYLQANVTALTDNHDGTSTLTLDSTVQVPTDASMSDPMHDGAGYKIINCQLGNTRSRGIIVKADNGLITGNVIDNCGLGLRIGPEYSSEADYCHTVDVENNTFVNNSWAFQVDGSSVKQNTGITVKGNRFIGSRGRDMQLDWLDGATIAGNSFAGLNGAPDFFKPFSPIDISNASNVTISDNQITLSPMYVKPLANVGGNVNNVTADAAFVGK